jgi:hypothetical protein
MVDEIIAKYRGGIGIRKNKMMKIDDETKIEMSSNGGGWVLTTT